MENYETIRLPWPDWKIVKYLGKGQYGKVYEIERTISGIVEKAALKIASRPKDESEVEAHYNNGYDQESIAASYEDEIRGYVREYKLMKELQGQSNIVSCDDFAVIPHSDGIGGDVFLRMELLTPLHKAVKEKMLSVQDTIRLGKDICRALMLCESRDIIHRDIKPENIMISRFGDFKLGDFGVSRVMDHVTYASQAGTKGYAAPEVMHMEKYGCAADIYSLGITMYWLLNNRRMPFLDADEVLKADKVAAAVARRYGGEELPPPRDGSPRLKQIVLRACAYRAQDRYATAEEMYQELDSLETEADTSQAGGSLGEAQPVRSAADVFRTKHADSQEADESEIEQSDGGTVRPKARFKTSESRPEPSAVSFEESGGSQGSFGMGGSMGNSWEDGQESIGRPGGRQTSRRSSAEEPEESQEKTIGKTKAFERQEQKQEEKKQQEKAAVKAETVQTPKKSKSGWLQWLAGVLILSIIAAAGGPMAILEKFTSQETSGSTSGKSSSGSSGTASKGVSKEPVISYYENGNTKQYTEYYANGQVEYDALYNEDGQELMLASYSEDGSLEWKNELAYDENGNLLRETMDYGYGEITVTDYNSAGRAERNTTYDKDGNMKYSSSYEYDSNGNRVKETFYNAQGELECWHTYEYTSAGEKTDRMYLPDGTLHSELFYNADGAPYQGIMYDSDGNVVGEAQIEASSDREGSYRITWPE